jgi:hypothetical protein
MLAADTKDDRIRRHFKQSVCRCGKRKLLQLILRRETASNLLAKGVPHYAWNASPIIEGSAGVGASHVLYFTFSLLRTGDALLLPIHFNKSVRVIINYNSFTSEARNFMNDTKLLPLMD